MAQVEACGRVYAGLSLLVNQQSDAVRDELEHVAPVTLAAELRG